MYPYAKNDPLNLIDPSGMNDEESGKYRRPGDNTIPWWIDFRPRMTDDGTEIKSLPAISAGIAVNAIAGAAGKALASAQGQKITGEWSSGPYNKLGTGGDKLDRHHFPQDKIGQDKIPDYKRGPATAIKVPEKIHEKMATVKSPEISTMTKNDILTQMANEAKLFRDKGATMQHIKELYYNVRNYPPLRKYLFKN